MLFGDVDCGAGGYVVDDAYARYESFRMERDSATSGAMNVGSGSGSGAATTITTTTTTTTGTGTKGRTTGTGLRDPSTLSSSSNHKERDSLRESGYSFLNFRKSWGHGSDHGNSPTPPPTTTTTTTAQSSTGSGKRHSQGAGVMEPSVVVGPGGARVVISGPMSLKRNSGVGQSVDASAAAREGESDQFGLVSSFVLLSCCCCWDACRACFVDALFCFVPLHACMRRDETFFFSCLAFVSSRIDGVG